MNFSVRLLRKENSSMAEYNKWLQKAEDDIRWTQHSLEGAIWYGACFSAQQSAEKSLKAYLRFRSKPLRKIHDLAALIEDCIRIDPSFESLRTQATTLTLYYITTRYPMYEDFAAITETQARQALADARSIFEFVRDRVTP